MPKTPLCCQWACPDGVGERRTEINTIDPIDPLVVVSYLECASTSEILHTGEGVLEHHVQEEPVDCIQLSRVVEVWQVPLEELGVEPHEVVLLQE